MGSGRMLRIVMLLGVVAGLALLNWKLAELPIDVSPVAVETAGESATSSPAAPSGEPSSRPLSDLGETLSRPLFHPTRRPVIAKPADPPPAVVKAEPAPAPAAVEPSRMRLLGLMRTGPTSQRALIRPDGQPYGTWVDLGGEIQGWRVSRIEDSRVLIEKAGGQEELRLHALGQ